MHHHEEQSGTQPRMVCTPSLSSCAWSITRLVPVLSEARSLFLRRTFVCDPLVSMDLDFVHTIGDDEEDVRTRGRASVC